MLIFQSVFLLAYSLNIFNLDNCGGQLAVLTNCR